MSTAGLDGVAGCIYGIGDDAAGGACKRRVPGSDLNSAFPPYNPDA